MSVALLNHSDSTNICYHLQENNCNLFLDSREIDLVFHCLFFSWDSFHRKRNSKYDTLRGKYDTLRGREESEGKEMN